MTQKKVNYFLQQGAGSKNNSSFLWVIL